MHIERDALIESKIRRGDKKKSKLVKRKERSSKVSWQVVYDRGEKEME